MWAEEPQLDLAVIGRDQAVALLSHEGAADGRPSSVRIGMFWRFGSEEGAGPWWLAASENEVWTRSVSRSACCCSESV